MVKRMFLTLVLAWGLPLSAPAQPSADVPPPREPILARAPGRAEWTISYRFDHDKAKEEILNPDFKNKNQSNGSAKASPMRLPKEIHVSKDGATYREIIVWSDGHKTEKWIVDGLQVRETSGGNVVRIMSPSSFYAPDYSDYSRSDFEDVEWINQSNYVGAQTLNGASVYAFETPWSKRKLIPREAADRASSEDVQPENDSGRTCTVFLDAATQLPVFFDDGQIIRTYTYSAGSPEKLIPSSKFSRVIERWKKEIKRKTAVPLPP